MRVVLVGGAGFVGTRLARRLLDAGHETVIVDKRTSQTFPDRTILGDVRNLDQLRSAIPPSDVLVNLAAEHRDDVRPIEQYAAVNVDGARNVTRVAEEQGIKRIIFTSSVACYGFGEPGAGEDAPIAPFNEYGRTKAAAENVYRAWQEQSPSERSLLIVRPTVIFGEGNRGNVYNLLRQIASGLFVMVGPGENVKSMAYVENVAAYLEHMLDTQPGQHVFNYIDKPDLRVRDIVSVASQGLGRRPPRFRIPYAVGYSFGLALDLIARATGRRFPLSAIRVKKFCATTEFSTRINGTGFRPPVSLEDGLLRTIEYEFLEDHSSDPVFVTE